MTYIEFFDSDTVKNILSCLTGKPDRVILIGKDLKPLQKNALKYQEFFLKKGAEIEFLCVAVNKNDLDDNIAKISEIIQNYDDCIFDITGGDEISVLALGIVYERFKAEKNIQIHQFNMNTNAVSDCDNDGIVIGENNMPKLSVEELIFLRGGKVVYEDECFGGTHRWNIDDEFIDDIKNMWEICRKDVRLWNSHANVLNNIEAHKSCESDVLLTVTPVLRVNDYIRKQGGNFLFDFSIMKSLYNFDIIREYKIDDSEIVIRYKNEQIKKCLTKAGLVLEMVVYVTALGLKDVYNDAMNGVCIDWDGIVEEYATNKDSKNEIDVIMMKGIVPVFVSCKNGCVDIEELYKFNSVAERFGGKNVRKILIATSLGEDVRSEYFRRRAKDMKIRLIEDIQNLSPDKLAKKIQNFSNN